MYLSPKIIFNISFWTLSRSFMLFSVRELCHTISFPVLISHIFFLVWICLSVTFEVISHQWVLVRINMNSYQQFKRWKVSCVYTWHITNKTSTNATSSVDQFSMFRKSLVWVHGILQIGEFWRKVLQYHIAMNGGWPCWWNSCQFAFRSLLFLKTPVNSPRWLILSATFIRCKSSLLGFLRTPTTSRYIYLLEWEKHRFQYLKLDYLFKFK